MALFTTHAVALQGIRGHVVDVQADVARGLPAFTLVGLPDASLTEARERVKTAVNNSGHQWPTRRVTVNLTPASLPKHGSSFDLSIAMAVLGCQGVIPLDAVAGTVFFGELGLDGRLRPSAGVLAAVYAAWQAGVSQVVVPWANHAQAQAIAHVIDAEQHSGGARRCQVVAAATLKQVLALMCGASAQEIEQACQDDQAASGASGWAHQMSGSPSQSGSPGAQGQGPDLSDVVGQPQARWALEIAAAGAHHLLMVGPPGAGKTMLAQRLVGILPPLEPEQAVEVASLASLVGHCPAGELLPLEPPFQQPHHSASTVALVGGGSPVIKPGAISLAHRGVLFLDEAPEFHTASLQALRQPLESGQIHVARANASVNFPAQFLLVMAANPCPCGYGFGRGERCLCPPHRKRAYFAKLSGPLVDRMDLRLVVQQPPFTGLMSQTDSESCPQPESSAVVRQRVIAARQRSSFRLREHGWSTNGQIPGSALRRHWPAQSSATGLLEDQLHRGALTLRGADRVLKVAWTLADLAAVPQPRIDEVSSALALRGNEMFTG